MGVSDVFQGCLYHIFFSLVKAFSFSYQKLFKHLKTNLSLDNPGLHLDPSPHPDFEVGKILGQIGVQDFSPAAELKTAAAGQIPLADD